ncbi:MAG: hypothetical protein DI565_16275 [Ancylobacter novellus]|uniref:Cytochrome c domain-containing protein n=1 Tax=Ancylobacter novellus TaxID=921 RepID=A0A2W5K5K0_ANCNO|nr:MAG: hypothetical protein DI565_16275 [Ancylobacter novellus]
MVQGDHRRHVRVTAGAAVVPRGSQALRRSVAALAVGTLACSQSAAGEERFDAPSLGEVVAGRCAACHGRPAAGATGSLEGRSAEAVASALRAYRDRGDPRAVMTSRAKLMTDAEIDAVAAYVASRPALNQGRR